MKTLLNDINRLKVYCKIHDYAGWDPYDGLNANIISKTFLKRVYFVRLFWIQLFKKLPFNLRPVFLINRQHNPKGIGLFISGYCQLLDFYESSNNVEELRQVREEIIYLADKLISLVSTGYSGDCWGYPFDWQNRVFFQPKNTPTVVATSFAADALFAAYERTGVKRYLSSALSACEFVRMDLNRSYNADGTFVFSYSPLDTSRVYNASLLGSRLLAKSLLYKDSNETLKLVAASTHAVVSKQSAKGSWIYGEAKVQNWIDSFHTGFNLECLYEIARITNDDTFKNSFDKGLSFYLQSFFEANGRPNYYHNQPYPIDIHSPAQLIITLVKSNSLSENHVLCEQVLKWTMKNMQKNSGSFIYQKRRFISSRVSYMRWADAWMFYSLSHYLNKTHNEDLD